MPFDRRPGATRPSCSRVNLRNPSLTGMTEGTPGAVLRQHVTQIVDAGILEEPPADALRERRASFVPDAILDRHAEEPRLVPREQRGKIRGNPKPAKRLTECGRHRRALDGAGGRWKPRRDPADAERPEQGRGEQQVVLRVESIHRHPGACAGLLAPEPEHLVARPAVPRGMHGVRSVTLRVERFGNPPELTPHGEGEEPDGVGGEIPAQTRRKEETVVRRRPAYQAAKGDGAET